MIDINYLKEHQLILFEAISGSRAYGLADKNSDTDIRGVFILPKTDFFGLNYIPQVSDEKNDVVYYEIGRFIELLIKGNPTAIELISSPASCIQIKNNLMSLFDAKDYLSKECEDRFAGYAMSQIKKAKGLKKKIHNPMEKERKTVLDFCYVNSDNGSIPLVLFLENNGISQTDCGLINISQMQNVYGLYYDADSEYKGIMKSANSNDIMLSSIPKEKQQKNLLYFNKDGYSFYCKSYKEYWEWVEKRNEGRYQNTLNHAKNYDSKNMMHTFRLLRMAKEIAVEKKVNVHRNDRGFLLGIKKGEFEYDDLLKKAMELMGEIKVEFNASTLLEKPNVMALTKLLVKIRTAFYSS